LSADEAYDFDALPVYIDSHQAAYDCIDDHVDEHFAGLQRWLQQPSISAQDIGVKERGQSPFGQKGSDPAIGVHWLHAVTDTKRTRKYRFHEPQMQEIIRSLVAQIGRIREQLSCLRQIFVSDLLQFT